MSQSIPYPLQPFCTCATCRSLNGARAGLATIPVHQMNTSQVEADAAALILDAERFLHAAQSILQQHHLPAYNHSSAIISPLSPYTAGKQHHAIGPNTVDGAPRLPASEDNSNHSSPTHVRQVTNPWDGKDPISPSKSDKSSDFQCALRARAAELGILRTATDNNPAPIPTTDGQQSPETKQQFLVCDHCRSHGIRCNEASVCKECIMREVPCTHRMCELSPDSKEDCPRQVCFYVHRDWMPDIYGKHDPSDPYWIILPGKVRERLSAGQLGRVSPKSDSEMQRCYQGVPRIQNQAKKDLTYLVQSGASTWETVAMACKCKEIEWEQQDQDKLCRLGVMDE